MGVASSSSDGINSEGEGLSSLMEGEGKSKLGASTEGVLESWGDGLASSGEVAVGAREGVGVGSGEAEGDVLMIH